MNTHPEILSLQSELKSKAKPMQIIETTYPDPKNESFRNYLLVPIL